MDLGNILYLVAVIGYFIYQMTKKKNPVETDQSGDLPEQKKERPATFEDLMREIREAQQPQKPRAQPIPPKPEPVKEEYKRPDSVFQRRSEKRDDDEISYYDGAYEKAKTAAEKAVPISELEFTDIGLKAYGKREVKENRYAKLMKNPQSVKDAVVLSEILNRKHF
ncbi:hypothetical protein JYB64_07025 [Algoriphagus aestuarii]|nr:hypothetical protein [Algoriphagus aestuarii]